MTSISPNGANDLHDFDPPQMHQHRRLDDGYDVEGEDGIRGLRRDVLKFGSRLFEVEGAVKENAAATNANTAAIHAHAVTGSRQYVDTMGALALLSSAQVRNDEADAAAAAFFAAKMGAGREELAALGAQVGKVAADGAAVRGELNTHSDIVAALEAETLATKAIAASAKATADLARGDARHALRMKRLRVVAVIAAALGAIRLVDAAHPWLHPIIVKLHAFVF